MTPATTWLAAGVLALAGLVVPARADAPQNAAGSPTVATPLPPQVERDGRVRFAVSAPRASRVAVFVDTMAPAAAVAMTKDARGTWTGTLGPLDPDIYGYGFVIDGAITGAGIVTVSGATPQAWDPRKVPHGTLHIHWYDSKAIGALRSVYVYTPPGYEHSTRTYPSLYLLHGSGGEESSWVNLGAANVILDNLIADGKAEPMVVVMPFGHTEASARTGIVPTYTGRNFQAFSDDLLQDVMPLVERTYRVARDGDGRAIAGFSMGGGQAREIGLGHLDLFHWIATFSGSFSYQGPALTAAALEQDFAGILADPLDTNRTLRLLWMACGDRETGLLAQNRMFSDVLNAHQIKNTLVTIPGEHTWHVWRRNLRDVLPLLFTKRR